VSAKVSLLHPDQPISGQYDLIFIDGDHSEEAVESDIEKAIEVLAPNGLLAFHDYRLEPDEAVGGWDEGVTNAVNNLIQKSGELIARHKTLAIVRPPVLVSQQ